MVFFVFKWVSGYGVQYILNQFHENGNVTPLDNVILGENAYLCATFTNTPTIDKLLTNEGSVFNGVDLLRCYSVRISAVSATVLACCIRPTLSSQALTHIHRLFSATYYYRLQG